MNDLRDLYQEVILDHNKRPRNFRILPQPRIMLMALIRCAATELASFWTLMTTLFRTFPFKGLAVRFPAPQPH